VITAKEPTGNPFLEAPKPTAKPAPVKAAPVEETVSVEEPAPAVREKKAAPSVQNLDSVLEAWGDDE